MFSWSWKWGGVLRMLPAAVVTVALIVIVARIAPMQTGILAYKAALLTGGAWLGYWADRLLFPYSRPHEVHDHHAEYRRAIVVAASIVAVGLSA